MEDLKTMILCDAKRLADMGDCIDRRLFDIVRKAQAAGVDLIYTRRKNGACIFDPDGEYVGDVVCARTPNDFSKLALATIECIENALGGRLETQEQRVRRERDEALEALEKAEEIIDEQKKVIASFECAAPERVC